jgi:hypothetical protein
VDAGEVTRVVVPVASLLSAVAFFSGRGVRTRSRLAKDLEIAERLPRGTAKQFLLDFAQEQTVRYVARERSRGLFWLTMVLFAGAAVCAALLADFVTPWVGDSSIGNIIKVAMGVLLGAGAAALAELPSFRKKQGKHTEHSVVRLSLTA